VRQFASNYVETKFADPLREFSGLDVLRIELNLSSFGAHGEKRILETSRALGDFERTNRGSSFNIRLEQRLPHNNLRPFIRSLATLSAEAGLLVKRFDDAAEQDVTDFELKGVFRFLIGK
jgi:hypothetical protein